jgi:hypothetical protein
MGGSAGEGDDFVAGNQNNRKVLQIVCPFALAAETQFFLVTSRIAISVSPTTVLRRRG